MNYIVSQTQKPRTKEFTEKLLPPAFLFRAVRVFRGSQK
jgi:hypothetical protein